MKGKRRKKYATGTPIRNYMENPYTELQQDKINNAKAKFEGETNPWVIGLKTAGNLAMQYGLSMAAPNGGSGFGDSGAGQAANSLLPILANMEFALGGMIPSVPVEIEGEEVGEMPDGTIFEAKGPSHEQGGIDVSLPEMTEMFSKRIKVDGVSMADRKKKRAKKEMTLQELLDKNGTDALLKNSLSRTKQNNEKEEQFDTNIQELVTSLLDPNTKKTNHLENINEKKQYQGGGTIYGPLMERLFNNKGMMESGMKIPDFSKMTGTTDDIHNLQTIKIPELAIPPIVPQQDNTFIRPLWNKILNDGNQDSIPVGIDADDPLITAKSGNPGTTSTTEEKSFLEKIFGGKDPNGGLTVGDATGFLGNMISTFGPYLNTLKNRSQDTPNINPYEFYGQEGLQVLDDTKEYVNQVRDEKLKNLELARTGAIKRGRNSARGVNTMRALDLATDQSVNNSQSEIHNQFAEQMMNILFQQAQMENQQDRMVMVGEDARDTRDRQDNDNFFTQMAQNIVGMGQGIQETGKDMNAVKQRKVMMNLINQLSKYGITVDAKGNLVTNKETN
jgi:hypothetical protein